MGGHMPYQLEKGPYFSVTESVFDDLELRITGIDRTAKHGQP